MTTAEKVDLITRHSEECLTPERLAELIDSGTELRHYIGFEISGQVHVGSGMMSGLHIANMQAAGVKCTIFLADWHTWINDKLGGDPEVIREMARGYFQQAMYASIKACGGDPDAINFVLGSELYADSQTYWPTVIEVSKGTTLARMQRSISILGRSEGESIDFAKLLYPPMQAADVFELGAHIAHAGTDQRKAHVLAIDTAKSLKMNPLKNGKGEMVKPVALHQHLLLGLGKPSVWPIPSDMNRQEMWTSLKMSKSKPDTAVFVTDEPDEIRRKVGKAFCPEGEVELNAILDWAKYLVYALNRGPLVIEREEQHGGRLELASYEDLEQVYAKKELHPMDLKAAVAEQVVELLAPVREHFAKDPHKGYLEKMKELRVTR